MPFREAHEQVAARIAAGERFAEPTPEEAVAARNAPGGTSPARVGRAALGAHLARRRDARLGQGVTPLGSPWPVTAQSRDGALEIGGVAAEELAARFGTPLYVYDAATLRERARAYVDGVAGHPDAHVSFACKACCTVGVLRLLGSCGLGADVASAGELAAALRAGIDPARIVVHGNGKTDADIEAALAAGCGLLVLDGLDEGARVAAAAERHGRRQPVAVRVTPGILAGGHEKIATGHEGSKFGLAPADAARACLEAREDPRLDWRGLHVHLGSQVDDAGVLEGVVRWFREFCDAHAPGAAPDRRRRRPRHPVRLRVGARRPRARGRRRGGRPAPLPGRAAADRAGPLGRGPRRHHALPRADAQDRRRRHALGRARRRHGRQPAPGALRRPLHRGGGRPAGRGGERARLAGRPPLRVR